MLCPLYGEEDKLDRGRISNIYGIVRGRAHRLQRTKVGIAEA